MAPTKSSTRAARNLKTIQVSLFARECRISEALEVSRCLVKSLRYICVLAIFTFSVLTTYIHVLYITIEY